MPSGRGSNLKNRELYEELRNEGASKEKAARISNAVATQGAKKVGRRGGKSGDYEDWTRRRSSAPARRSSGSGATRANARRSSSRCSATTETQSARATTGPGAPRRIPRLPARARRHRLPLHRRARRVRAGRGRPRAHPRAGHPAGVGGRLDLGRAATATSRPSASMRPAGASTCTTRSGARAAIAASSPGRSRSPRRCRAPAAASRPRCGATGSVASACSRPRSACSTRPRPASGRRATSERHGSRGLTTLQRRDAAIEASVVTLSFPGKSGKRAFIEIDDDELAAVMAELAAGRPALGAAVVRTRPAARAADAGGRQRARAVADRRRLHREGLPDAPRHDLRGRDARADRHGRHRQGPQARRARSPSRRPPRRSGNTPAVARGSYIDPRVWKAYERGRAARSGGLAGVRDPAAHRRVARADAAAPVA